MTHDQLITYRFFGMAGLVNTPSADRRVLAHGPRAALDWGLRTGQGHPPEGVDLPPLPMGRIPFPITCPSEGAVGVVDEFVMSRYSNEIHVRGRICVAGPGGVGRVWGVRLLNGEPQAVGLDVDRVERETIGIRHAGRLFVKTNYEVLTSWRPIGLTLIDPSKSVWTNSFIMLGNRVQPDCEPDCTCP